MFNHITMYDMFKQFVSHRCQRDWSVIFRNSSVVLSFLIRWVDKCSFQSVEIMFWSIDALNNKVSAFLGRRIQIWQYYITNYVN